MYRSNYGISAFRSLAAELTRNAKNMESLLTISYRGSNLIPNRFKSELKFSKTLFSNLNSLTPARQKAKWIISDQHLQLYYFIDK